MINWIKLLMPIIAFNQQQSSEQLINILYDMFRHQQYETLILIDDKYQENLILRHESHSSNTTKLSSIPKLLLSPDKTLQSFRNSWNSKLLIVFNITTIYSKENHNILKNILATQKKNLNIKIMALISLPIKVTKEYLRNYFLYFQHLKLYDVLVVAIKANEINTYYTYRVKPFFEILPRKFNATKSQQYFIEQIENLQQQPLFTYPDQLQPRTLLYYNERGALEMLGYIGRLITTYAEKINASLKYAFPVKLNNPIFFADLYELTTNGSLDIAASMASISRFDKPEYFSRFVELSKWFPMLPVSDYITRLDIYYILIFKNLVVLFFVLLALYSFLHFIFQFLHKTSDSLQNLLIKSLLNHQVFLGLLALSFKIDYNDRYYKSYRFFILLIQFSGFMLVVFTNIYLTSNITTPPKYPEINTFPQLHERKLNILMLTPGYRSLINYAGDEYQSKYGSSVIPVTNISKFIELRNNFNKSYGFAVTTNIWSIFEKQQLFFSEKLFRYVPEMYFNDHMIFALPLQKNSIYEKSLNRYIANLMASGILQYWYDSSFFDMIKTGHMSFKDLSHARKYEAGQFKDFLIIWLIFAGGIGLSILVFILELIVYKIKNRNK